MSECWLRLCSDRHNFSISLLRSKDKSPKKSIATKFEDVAVVIVVAVIVEVVIIVDVIVAVVVAVSLSAGVVVKIVAVINLVALVVVVTNVDSVGILTFTNGFCFNSRIPNVSNFGPGFGRTNESRHRRWQSLLRASKSEESFLLCD